MIDLDAPLALPWALVDRDGYFRGHYATRQEAEPGLRVVYLAALDSPDEARIIDLARAWGAARAELGDATDALQRAVR